MIIFFFSSSFFSLFFLLSLLLFPFSSFFHSLFIIHCFFYPSLLLVLNFLFLLFPRSLSFSHPVSRIHYFSLSLSFTFFLSITIFSSRCYSTPLLLFLLVPYFFLSYLFFFLFVCYMRLCTENRLPVYSGSVSAVLRTSPLRSRISRKTTRFIHGDHRYARFADTRRRN